VGTAVARLTVRRKFLGRPEKQATSMSRRPAGPIHLRQNSAGFAWVAMHPAAGTDEAQAVMSKMREMPINDFFAKNGRIREDGRWCTTCMCTK
jgi:hypothetical protein